jgi:two-component system, NtrC family, sensor kinase
MRGTVLIVDDSLTVRMDLCEAFEAEGVATIGCATVAEALAALERTEIALAVLDVVLPDGDGIDLLARIRARPAGADVPVLMLSTEADVRYRIRGLMTGSDDYVGKPYNRDYVVARARELIRRRARSDRPGGASILLIDDSVTFRNALGEALEAQGYSVLTAASGEEGLRNAAAHLPTAIVVDGMLPGLDGATVVRKLRLDAALRHIPCVLLTGSEDRGAELRALDAGADAFVRKEEELELILARIGAAVRSAHGAAPASATASLLGPKRILAVDDSATYLHELAEALRADGYDVIAAHSGAEALEMLAVQPVDCILLDRIMPDMDGAETCERIKAAPALREIPLIMLTSLDDRDAMIAALSRGADDYVLKANEMEVIKARVRTQLRRKQFEDESRRIREELLSKEIEAAEARAAKALAAAKAVLIDELERKNQELEAFSYSVSHDLRTPLRAIDGFSRILLSEHAASLDDVGRNYLERVRRAAQRMGTLIDDLLMLSRVARAEACREPVDIGIIADEVIDALRKHEPDRVVETRVATGLPAHGDPRLLRIALENLLGNAWKFTGKCAAARIEFGADGSDTAAGPVYHVRDNGAGFDMQYVSKLFAPFQRLHGAEEFPGTGIGLATVQRIVQKHGGRIWAESTVGTGTTFYFTLASKESTR